MVSWVIAIRAWRSDGWVAKVLLCLRQKNLGVQFFFCPGRHIPATHHDGSLIDGGRIYVCCGSIFEGKLDDPISFPTVSLSSEGGRMIRLGLSTDNSAAGMQHSCGEARWSRWASTAGLRLIVTTSCFTSNSNQSASVFPANGRLGSVSA